MKMIIVFAAIVACALAVPVPDDADTTILKNDIAVGVDTYSFDVETSDGQKKSETGELKNAGAEDEAIAVRGSFSFVGLDGVTYTVNYVADENGFQPEGEHLPKA